MKSSSRLIFARYEPRDPLLRSQIRRSTLTEYSRKVAGFLHYYNKKHPNEPKLDLKTFENFLPQFVSDEDCARFDDFLARYLSREWKKNPTQSSNFGSTTLNGLCYFQPQLITKLPRTRRRILGWRRAVPRQSRVAIPWSMAAMVAVLLARQNHFDLSVGVLLSFDCMLRVSELVNICLHHIETGPSDKAGSSMVIRLPVTKTGINKYATIHSKALVRLLLLLMKKRKSIDGERTRLIPLGKQSFRSYFKRACHLLNFDRFNFSPHSLRGGGATYLHDAGVSVDRIMHRGRWTQMKSLNGYIQSGRAIFIEYQNAVSQQRQELPLTLSSTEPEYITNLIIAIQKQQEELIQKSF